MVPVLLTFSQIWRPLSQEGQPVTWYHESCGEKRKIEKYENVLQPLQVTEIPLLPHSNINRCQRQPELGL